MSDDDAHTPHHLHHHQAEAVPQMTLRETALDACSRKRHAVSRGYFADPYLRYFTADSTYINSPLMNRGYWLRVRAVESAVNRFVEALPAGSPFQVVSLGAGYDTLFFRWAALATGLDSEHAASAPVPSDEAGTHVEEDQYALSHSSAAGAALREGRLRRFIEIDQHEVAVGKLEIIAKHQDLSTLAFNDPNVYRLVAADLCHVELLHNALLAQVPPNAGTTPHAEPHEVALASRGVPTTQLLDPTVPTLILAECVLVYLSSQDSTTLLNEIVNNTLAPCPQVGLLSYDAVNPNTPFGRQMVSSLKARGVELKGIADLPTPKHHADRCRSLGFNAVAAWSMKSLFANVPIAIQKRLQHIEPLDDYDEWCLVHEHYSMTWALKTTAADATASLKLFDNSGDVVALPTRHA